MDEINETQAWKQKYLNSLDELEAKERHWAETEQVLRQGLARLSLAADTADYELNQSLESLRKLLRNNGDAVELKALLERLVEPIRRLDAARRGQQLPPAPNELMELIISRLSFPRGMGHRAKALQKRLLQSADLPHAQLVDEFVALLVDALKWQDEETGSGEPVVARRGLLGRLLPGRGDAQAMDAPETDSDLARKLLEVMLDKLADHADVDMQSLRGKVQKVSHQAEVLRLGRELAGLLYLGPSQPVVDGEELSSPELLIRLLEHMEIPAELNAQTEMIREMLGSPDVSGHMERVIAAMADLVREIRHRVMNEKNEIENFLSQLTDRLREIDEGFQANISGQRAAYEGGRQLDERVHEQVSGIEQSVTEAQDLSGLKNTLATRIDTIRNHMQQFRRDQDQRLEEAEIQVSELNQQVVSMQQESDQLRTRIKQQRDLAMTDPLTGVPNRLAYNERIALEHARWKRYGQDLVLAVWDVDLFKLVNDTYGHQAGDKVLTVIAKLLQSKVRETDFVARFGGEEFLLVMPETDLEGAMVLAEQLRLAVEACEFHFRGKRVPITISCGMSVFQGSDTPEQVFTRADAALYKAKEGGRNQCRSA